MNKQICAMVLAGVVVCGCGKPDVEPEVSATDLALAEMSALVDAGHQSGEWAPALARLEAAFVDDSLVSHRSDIFRDLLMATVSMGETNKAVELQLSQLEDEQLCGVGCTVIGPVLAGIEGREAFLAWCERLTAEASVPWVRERAWSSLLDGARQRSELVPFVKSRLADMLANDASVQERVISMAGRMLLEEKELDAVELLFSDLGAWSGELPWLAPLAVQFRLDVLGERGAWAEARALLLEEGLVLSDRDLWLRCRRAMDSLPPEAATVDAFVARLNEAFISRASTVDRIGSHWVDLAVKSGDVSAFVSRCEALVAGGVVGAAAQFRAFSGGFYKLTSLATEAQRLRIQAVASGLEGKELPLRSQQALALVRLDAAFYLDDWRGAIAVLDDGVPERDEAWHEQIKNKVEAHLALSENRFEDAIAGFRRYMVSVDGWDEGQASPETGEVAGKEVILGFNAKRIGDIYAKMSGQEAKMRAAYDEARGYYKVALAQLEAGDKAYATVEAEMAEVP